MKKSIFTIAASVLLIFATTSCNNKTTNDQWVDLGLPSGTLWATCNLGADAPEQNGDYFAWGESKTKNVFSWESYAYGGEYDQTGATNPLTKYCSLPESGLNGFTDNLTTIEASDDAATVLLGNDACIPTKEQWDELMDNTTVEWTTVNDVKGLKFTSRTNEASIFLPAAGGCYDSGRYDEGSCGYYYSSSLNTEHPVHAWACYLSANSQDMGSTPRYYGFTVRAVSHGQK